MHPCRLRKSTLHVVAVYQIAMIGRAASLRVAWFCFAQQARSFHFRHRAHAPITPRSTNFSQWVFRRHIEQGLGRDVAS